MGILNKVKLLISIKLGKVDSAHQWLMNRAYDTWEPEEDYTEFLERLDTLHRDAVVLGNLNYQVENGGWMQWYLNGYIDGLSYIHDALDRFEKFSEKASDLASKLRDMLEEVEEECKLYLKIHKFQSYSDFDELESLVANEGYEEIPTIGDIENEIQEGDIEEIIDHLGIREFVDMGCIRQAKSVKEVAEEIKCAIVWRCSMDLLDSIRENLDMLSSRYYEFNDEFLGEIEKWLRSRI